MGDSPSWTFWIPHVCGSQIVASRGPLHVRGEGDVRETWTWNLNVLVCERTCQSAGWRSVGDKGHGVKASYVRGYFDGAATQFSAVQQLDGIVGVFL